jgi:FixJ family two-component response regulator
LWWALGSQPNSQSAKSAIIRSHATKVQYLLERRFAIFFFVKTDIQAKSAVYIIDNDPSVLRGLGQLMMAHGYNARTFASAREILAGDLPAADACLLIDVAMPEMDGLKLYAELLRRGCKAPAIFITALDDPAVRESVKRLGGAGFFGKPVDGNELLAAVRGLLQARKAPEAAQTSART